MHESQRYGKLAQKSEECRPTMKLRQVRHPNGHGRGFGNQSTEFSPGGRKDRGNVDNLLCAKCVVFATAGLAGTWPDG